MATEEVLFKEAFAEKVDLEGITWLNETQLELLKKTLDHISLSDLVTKPIVDQNAAKLVFIPTDKDAAVTGKAEPLEAIVQNVQYDKKTFISLLASGDGEDLIIKVYHLTTLENGSDVEIFVSSDNGVLVGDSQQPTDKSELFFPNVFDEFSAGKVHNDDEVSTQAWYSNIPCVANGCCWLPEYYGNVPIYNQYKWCGAGCGSGTPINSLDTCCKSHDECYKKTPSYPGRCGCDYLLRTCAAKSTYDAASTISAAFLLKMKAQGCKTS